MTFDLRTRTGDDIPGVDAARFHQVDVPAHLAVHGEVATRAFRGSGMPAFTVAVDGVEHTWRLDAAGDLEVVPGDTGAGPRVDLSTEWFADLVNDVRSAVAVMIADEPVMARGRIGHLLTWEPTLRALVDGRPHYEPGMVDFVDGDGAPLDLERSFTLDDDPAELTWFLAQAGFLHVRSVFGDAEMDDLAAEVDHWRAQMTPGDNRAWYARVGDEQVCVRVTNLPADDLAFPMGEGLAPFEAIAGGRHRYAGTDLLVKPVGVTEGISDLPWHRDCELGMHSYRCASLTCGVSVTPSGTDDGALGVLAGSHRVNLTILEHEEVDLPRRHLAAERGDVTVHLSCTLHCAVPPRHRPRYVTYSSLVLPTATTELDRKRNAIRDQAGRDTFAPT